MTRPPRQAAELSDRLRALGAEVVEVPTIRIQSPPDRRPLQAAVGELASYDWLILTSVNGVRRLREAMEETGVDPSAASACRVAAIGPATADEVRAAGFPSALVPDRYRAESLLAAVLAAVGGSLAGRRVLLPRAAEARDVLPVGLREAGAEVDEVTAYVTVPAEESADDLRALLAGRGVDWVTFTASSTVRSFEALAGASTGRARVATIGPITAATARELGFRVDVIAAEHTVPGLVRALVGAETGGERAARLGGAGGSDVGGRAPDPTASRGESR